MKQITFAIVFLFIPLMLLSQDIGKKTSFGIYYGLSINNVYDHVDGPDVQFDDNFSPILFGGYISSDLTNLFSLAFELEYVHKGPEFYKIDYLIGTLLAKYQVHKNFDLSPLIGVYGGYLFEYEINGKERNHEELKGYDLGIEGGLEYKIKLREDMKLFISPRVEVGLTRFSFTRHISYQMKFGIEF